MDGRKGDSGWDCAETEGKKICQAPYGTEAMAVNLTESRVFLGALQGVPGS